MLTLLSAPKNVGFAAPANVTTVAVWFRLSIGGSHRQTVPGAWLWAAPPITEMIGTEPPPVPTVASAEVLSSRSGRSCPPTTGIRCELAGTTTVPTAADAVTDPDARLPVIGWLSAKMARAARITLLTEPAPAGSCPKLPQRALPCPHLGSPASA